MNKRIGPLILLRMLVTLIHLLIILPVLSLAMMVLSMLTLGKFQNFLTSWIGYLLGRTTLAVAGVGLKVKYHGKIPQQPAVYLINHSSTLDFFIYLSICPYGVRFIAKKELQYNPFFWVLGKLSGQIMIDRKDYRDAHSKLNRAYETVRSKRLSLMIAPEGTRSLSGRIGPFKSGAFRTAVELGYPVVPVFVAGAWELCPGNSLITRPGTVTVHFHDPVDTSGWDLKHLRPHINRMHERYLAWSGETDVPAEYAPGSQKPV